MGIPVGTAGIGTPPAGDKATEVVAGTFNASGQSSPPWTFYGPFNVVFGGAGGQNSNWSGTVVLQRSFDGGATWWTCGIGGGGQQAIWNTPNQDVSVIAGEPERGVAYRLLCTAFGGTGNITYRLSTSGLAAMTLSVGSVIG